MQEQSEEPISLPSIDRPAFSTSKFADARDYMVWLTKPYTLAQPHLHFPLFFSHSRAQLKHMCFDLVTIDCRTPFQIAGPELQDQYLLQLPLAGSCRVEQDDKRYVAKEGSVFVINPFSPSRKHWNGGLRQLMIWIDRSTMEAVLQDEVGFELDKPLIFDTSQPESNKRISGLVRSLVNVIVNFDLFNLHDEHWRNIRQLERWLIVKILTSLPHNYSHEICRSENDVAPFYVRRVEKFFKDNLAEPITMRDVYKVAGVSERALFYGYRQFRRTTPMAHLKMLRLEEARMRLLRASEVGGSVTNVAASCGFGHPGIFAREYKRRFGETPSDTLKRGAT